MIKTIKLSKIKISSAMQKCPPNPEKLKKKYNFYKLTRLFASVIIVDKKYNLVDGYITYLLAKMFGVKKIDVEILKQTSVNPIGFRRLVFHRKNEMFIK